MIGLEGNRRIGSDVIVGDFFVCGSDEEGNLTSLTDEQLERYRALFYEPQEITEEEIQAKSGFIFFFFLKIMRLMVGKLRQVVESILYGLGGKGWLLLEWDIVGRYAKKKVRIIVLGRTKSSRCGTKPANKKSRLN